MGEVMPLDSCGVVTVHPDKVALTRQSIPDPTQTARLTALFKLLGDPRRARILYALLEAGELCVCDLAATIDAPEASVSQALRLLRTAGIVENRRAGRTIYYRLADAHVRMLLDLSREHVLHDEEQS